MMHIKVLCILRCVYAASEPIEYPRTKPVPSPAPIWMPNRKPSQARPHQTAPPGCKCHDPPPHMAEPSGSRCKVCQHWKICCKCVYPNVTTPSSPGRHPLPGHFARDCGTCNHGPHTHAKRHCHLSGHGPTALYHPVPSSSPAHGPGNMSWTTRQQQMAAVICALTFELPSHDSLLHMALQAPLQLIASIGKEHVIRVIWDSGASLSILNSKDDFVGDFKPAPIWVRLMGLASRLREKRTYSGPLWTPRVCCECSNSQHTMFPSLPFVS